MTSFIELTIPGVPAVAERTVGDRFRPPRPAIPESRALVALSEIICVAEIREGDGTPLLGAKCVVTLRDKTRLHVATTIDEFIKAL